MKKLISLDVYEYNLSMGTSCYLMVLTVVTAVVYTTST